MANFAQGSRSSLSYIEEATFGTTPAGNFTNLPINTHSLSLTKDRVQGNEIQADRITRVDRHGNRQVGGDVVVDLRMGDYDPLIESAMFSSFATDDTIKVGTTLKSFTMEDAFNDITQYRLFTGLAVSNMSVSIAPNQMVTTTFSFVGKDNTNSGTKKTITPSSTNQPFDSYSGAITLNDSGATASTISSITSVDFSVDNGLNPTFVVGSSSTPQLEYGRATIEGTLSAYVEDIALLNRFIDETETELEVSVDDPTGSNAYTFLFPRIKLNTGDIPLGGEQSRMISISFVALYDETEESNLVITRSTATT